MEETNKINRGIMLDGNSDTGEIEVERGTKEWELGRE